jgi:DNA-binding response OmpR family regulator
MIKSIPSLRKPRILSEKSLLGKKMKTKVLVIHNETEFASMLARRLNLRNIKTKTLNYDEVFQDSIVNLKPTVILLDLQRSDRSGLDLLSRIKTIDSTIEVILLTENDSLEVGITGMELGAFDALVKPIDLVFLIERISEAHKKKKGR